MLTTTIAALLAAQTPVSPMPPAGASGTFCKSVYTVQQELEKGDFAGAGKLLLRLPKKSIRLEWDDQNVPPAKRTEWAEMRDLAITRWKELVRDLTVTLAKPGDIKISFSKDRLPSPDGLGPAGAVFLESLEPQDPVLEGVIGLWRTEQKLPIQRRDVHNEVGFAIGRYLGLERTQATAGYMSRLDMPYLQDFQAIVNYGPTVRENFEVIRSLSEAVAKKQKVVAAKPDAFFEPAKLVGGSVLQGTPAQLSLQVTNRGNAPLKIRLVPDCSCFSFQIPREIAPGRTETIRIQADSSGFQGPQHKNFFFYSNDFEVSERRIPVEFTVEPLYRILQDGLGEVVVADDAGFKKDFFFVPSELAPMKVLSARLVGVKAMVDVTTWEGSRADPMMNEPEKPRKGYRIQVLGTPNLPPGRVMANLMIQTDHPIWTEIPWGFEVQKGIAAFPPAIYFGEIRSAGEATMTLSRPGKAFAVTSIRTSSNHFKASQRPGLRKGDIQITVAYDGKLPAGDISQTMTITTDDPKQKEIVVPLSGVQL